MSEKFQNKYRIASARMQSWDYGSCGAYFITICTKNRVHYFGNVVDGVMELSAAGKIADEMWFEIKNHSSKAELGEFVVMPNHIHGIVVLNAETRHALSVPHSKSNPDQSYGQKRFRNPGKGTVSSIIGGYKSAVTKNCNRMGLDFAWQSRFHDHIIRDAASFNRISNYIRNNPKNWKGDTFWKR